MVIEDADYFIRVVPFPKGCGCKAMVLLNDDSTYSVYADPTATREDYLHELRHLERDDFFNNRPITEIEDFN